MNFAISLAIKAVDSGEHDSDDLDDIWIYLLGFLLGGVLGAALNWLLDLGIEKTGTEKKSGENKPLKEKKQEQAKQESADNVQPF